MRTPSLIALALLALPALAPAQEIEYSIDIDSSSLRSTIHEHKGKNERRVTLKFRFKRIREAPSGASEAQEKIVIEEVGVPVHEVPLFQANNQPLTVVLAMDVSGSMARGNKMKEAKRAALKFLDKLGKRTDVGLILFDHEVKRAIAPAKGGTPQDEHRDKIREEISDAKPQGGTAYHDATIKAVEMLKGVRGRKVVVVMTDGMDTNSKASLQEAIDAALTGELAVYTVGIGKPGENKQVTTVLVLDRSGSMRAPADTGDKKLKIDALKDAAKRFVGLMRKGAQTTLLPFSSTIDTPEPLSSDAKQLAERIDRLEPRGGTLLFDATFNGIEFLAARKLPGKKAVVVLTDGRDEAPGSRRSDAVVIERAKQAGIPLYMLGLGRKNEIDEQVMQKMAEKTGGSYYHAGSARKLLDVFEGLSIQLHDDGIDEASLRKLAEDTGGTYSHAGDIDKLSFIYEKLADELQEGIEAKFTSRLPKHDGTGRSYVVKIYRDGKLIGSSGRASDVVRGLVVPQMGYWEYLGLLGGLVVLLVVPNYLHRAFRPAARE